MRMVNSVRIKEEVVEEEVEEEEWNITKGFSLNNNKKIIKNNRLQRSIQYGGFLDAETTQNEMDFSNCCDTIYRLFSQWWVLNII